MARITPHDSIMTTLFNGAQEPPEGHIDWDHVRAGVSAQAMVEFGDSHPLVEESDPRLDMTVEQVIANYGITPALAA